MFSPLNRLFNQCILYLVMLNEVKHLEAWRFFTSFRMTPNT